MEAATKNKRGRPKTFSEITYSFIDDVEQRAAQNKIYATAAIELLEQKPGDFFLTNKGNFRRQGIAEQIGRLIHAGYATELCKEIAEAAITFYEKGYSVKTIEKWIRAGKTAGEWF